MVQQALDECRKEIASKDMDVKAAAVLKLVYVSPSNCGERGASELSSLCSRSWRCSATRSLSLPLRS